MFANKTRNVKGGGSPAPVIRMAAYLEKLNPDQRAAVEHGIGVAADARPLLVIAGAGSGKTDTLAHRVAHLVMTGVDPHRILLLTFSRRAAAEMERRAERILNRAAGTNAQCGPAVGRNLSRHRRALHARVRRAHRARSRVHDPRPRGCRRPDEPRAARTRSFAAPRTGFPTKGTCLSIYSRAVNAESPLEERARARRFRGARTGRLS